MKLSPRQTLPRLMATYCQIDIPLPAIIANTILTQLTTSVIPIDVDGIFNSDMTRGIDQDLISGEECDGSSWSNTAKSKDVQAGMSTMSARSLCRAHVLLGASSEANHR